MPEKNNLGNTFNVIPGTSSQSDDMGLATGFLFYFPESSFLPCFTDFQPSLGQGPIIVSRPMDQCQLQVTFSLPPHNPTRCFYYPFLGFSLLQTTSCPWCLWFPNMVRSSELVYAISRSSNKNIENQKISIFPGFLGAVC